MRFAVLAIAALLAGPARAGAAAGAPPPDAHPWAQRAAAVHPWALHPAGPGGRGGAEPPSPVGRASSAGDGGGGITAKKEMNTNADYQVQEEAAAAAAAAAGHPAVGGLAVVNAEVAAVAVARGGAGMPAAAAVAPRSSQIAYRRRLRGGGAVEQQERKLNGDGYVMSGNEELQTAVGAWCSDEAAAEATYGPISTWKTGQVTSMSFLFNRNDSNWDDVGGAYCSTYDTFNADISNWDGK